MFLFHVPLLLYLIQLLDLIIDFFFIFLSNHSTMTTIITLFSSFSFHSTTSLINWSICWCIFYIDSPDGGGWLDEMVSSLFLWLPMITYFREAFDALVSSNLNTTLAIFPLTTSKSIILFSITWFCVGKESFSLLK